jgi:1,4-dihydroxy-2-naphthoate octaprenyltransferase
LKRFNILTWISASRPQTLPASIVPVLTGASLAHYHQLFRWDTTIVALICALLIQIGTNFANDYYDFIKGADREDRIGFIRATSAGLVTPQAMFRATYLTMTIAFFTGLYLVWVAGWPIFLIGVLSLIFGVAYTGGPYPLGYNGLGDIFVFIFFGFAAVMGTYYVNALEWSADAMIASMPVGALAVNILVINNLRDVHQDVLSGKKTLGVLLGENALKAEYTFLIVLSFVSLIILDVLFGYPAWIYLPLLSLPVAALLLKQVFLHDDKRTLNKTLEQTAQFMILFGLLLSAGILLS